MRNYRRLSNQAADYMPWRASSEQPFRERTIPLMYSKCGFKGHICLNLTENAINFCSATCG